MPSVKFASWFFQNISALPISYFQIPVLQTNLNCQSQKHFAKRHIFPNLICQCSFVVEDFPFSPSYFCDCLFHTTWLKDLSLRTNFSCPQMFCLSWLLVLSVSCQTSSRYPFFSTKCANCYVPPLNHLQFFFLCAVKPCYAAFFLLPKLSNRL